MARVEPQTPSGAHQHPLLLPLLPRVTPKKRPQRDNASPEGNNSKKRRLAWMAKSLIAAGLDVKFPAEQ